MHKTYMLKHNLNNLTFEDKEQIIRILRLKTRRGMRELDIILSAYLESKEKNLTPSFIQIYYDFLENQDLEIYSWIFYQEALPYDSPFQGIIEELRGILVRES